MTIFSRKDREIYGATLKTVKDQTASPAAGDSDPQPQMAKNPLADSDSDLEEILPEPEEKAAAAATKKPLPRNNNKRPPPPQSKRKKDSAAAGGKKAAKRRRKADDSNSDDEDFDPGSDDDDEDGSEEADEESVRSEDLSPEENISDSDFIPSDEAEVEEEEGGSVGTNDETIQLSSDGESPMPDKSAAKGGRETIQTFDPNSTVRALCSFLLFLRKKKV